MFKKRFLLGLALSSIVLVSLTLSSFTIMNSPFTRELAGSYAQQRISWIGSPQVSNTYHLDCFRRQYNFSKKESSQNNQKDASNYFMSLS